MEPLVDERPLLDEQLEMIAHVARRRVLLALADESIGENGLVDVESASDGVDVPVPLSVMYHRHLPRLEDHGFIRWDRQEHLVARGPQFEEIRPLLEAVAEHRDELAVE